MEMKKVKLGDICSKICSGGTPLSKNLDYYNPPVIPWLTTSEVNYSRIYSTQKYISEDGLNNSSAKLIPENSVIIAMYGQGNTAGRVAINKIPLATNQACCNLIINPEIADFQYVYYTLSAMYNDLIVLKSGGAQPNLNAKKIKEFEIPFPSIEVQRTIGKILSAYDDMIDNCKKQIALLEEAAQRLYREWFVDLRFPGHETTPIGENGLPNGWRNITLSDFGVSLESGKRPNVKILESDSIVPSIGAENVIGLGNYNFDKEKFITEEFFLDMRKGKLKDNDILIYKDGAYIGKTTLFRDGFPHEKAAVNEHVFLLRSNKANFQNYLFLTLYQQEYYDLMQGLNSNSAQPGLSIPKVLNLKITIPPTEIIEMFNAIIEPIFALLFSRANQLKLTNIAKQEIIAPLISGQIEINA